MAWDRTVGKEYLISSGHWNEHVALTKNISSNLLSWKKISGLSDIAPSSATGGQVLAWNTSLNKYTPSTITLAGTTNLSDVIINTNKGWLSYGITGMGYLSSNAVSGGIVSAKKIHSGPISSNIISGGQLTTDKIVIPHGTDGITFVDTNTKIYESVDALYLEADDDLILNPDDDISIRRDGTAYARFGGHERGLQIRRTGAMTAPAYTLQIIGSIFGTEISGTSIRGATVKGGWSGSVIKSVYIESSAKYSNAYTSGAKYTKAYLSGQKAMYDIRDADDIDNGVGGGWDSTAFTNSGIKWNGTYWVPMPSGGSGGGGGGTPGGITTGDVQYRIDASTFGAESNFNYNATDNSLNVYHISAITISAQIISGGSWSGAVIDSRYIASSAKYSETYNWYDTSSSKLSNYLASGDEYSTAYSERGSQIDGDDLTWDGSQLNVDDSFIRNDVNDSTTGVITAAGFKTTAYISSTILSGGAIKGRWQGATIDDDYIESGTKFQTAYEWFSQSSQALSGYYASGDEYSAAYASAQALKEHALQTIISGQYIKGYIASANTVSRYYPSTLGALHQYLSGLTDVADMTNKSDGYVLSWDSTQSKWSSQTSTTVPSGTNGFIQFDNANSFSADASLTWDNSNNI